MAPICQPITSVDSTQNCTTVDPFRINTDFHDTVRIINDLLHKYFRVRSKILEITLAENLEVGYL